MTGDHDRDGGEVPQGERDDRPELDIDTAFAAIVAGLLAQPEVEVGHWPAAEDLSDDDDDGTDDGSGADTGRTWTGRDRRGEPTSRGERSPRGAHRGEPADADPPDSRGDPDDDPQLILSGPSAGPLGGAGGRTGEVLEDDEGYVPPEPPPLPRGDLASRAAWAGVLGGPLFLLIAAIVWQSLPKMLLLAALAAFVGGFVTLVARMPSEPPDEPDDGAVV